MNSFMHHLILLKCAIKEIVWVLKLTLLAVEKSNHSEIFKSLAILLSKTPSNVIDRGVVISVLWEITTTDIKVHASINQNLICEYIAVLVSIVLWHFSYCASC